MRRRAVCSVMPRMHPSVPGKKKKSNRRGLVSCVASSERAASPKPSNPGKRNQSGGERSIPELDNQSDSFQLPFLLSIWGSPRRITWLMGPHREACFLPANVLFGGRASSWRVSDIFPTPHAWRCSWFLANPRTLFRQYVRINVTIYRLSCAFNCVRSPQALGSLIGECST